jgi:hypothetical protein
MVMEAVAARQDDGDLDDPDASAGIQLSIDDFVKPADWLEGKNWGTLSIDASGTLADITYPTDLKSLNEARESTERISGTWIRSSPSLYGSKLNRSRKVNPSTVTKMDFLVPNSTLQRDLSLTIGRMWFYTRPTIRPGILLLSE